MRLLMLSQWFDPEPCYKGLPFARALRDRGFSVQVITGFPNYPGGRLYPGYGVRLWQRETLDGFSILRVPLYPSHSNSSLGRMANYASFAVSAAALGPFLTKPVDVLYVYHPPGTVALPALALKALRRIPFVYDVQDLWPDTLRATGMFNSSFGLKCVGAWCSTAYRQAAKIVVLSPGFKRILTNRGVPPNKIEVIYNWCSEEGIIATLSSPSLAEELGMAGRFNVLFAGTMGRAQALNSVLEAARRLQGTLPRVQFVFLGGGIDVPRLKQKAQDARLDNVRFLPRRAPGDVPPILKLADALLVHLGNDPLFEITIPSKTQTYLAAGRPVIMGVRGDAAELVRQAGAGLVCEPENPQALAEAVTRLYRMSPSNRAKMGLSGKAFYDKHLAMAIGVDKFAAIFTEVGSQRGKAKSRNQSEAPSERPDP